MSLLEDIQADHDQLSVEISSLAQIVFLEMCDAVKVDHGCRPVVVGMVDDQTELHFPTWRTDSERSAAYANISDGLTEREALGAICAFSGTISTEDEERLQAVIVMVHTLGWKKMMVQPYRIRENHVQWREAYITEDFDSPLLDFSCAN